MNESLQNIIDIILNPRAVFTRLKYAPKWGMVLLVYCFFSLIVALTLMPYTQKLLATGSVVSPLSDNETVSFLLVTVLSMVYTISMAIILSVIFSIVVRTLRIWSGIGFKHICSAFFHIMLIRVLTFTVNAALLPIFRDIEEIRRSVDTRVIPGLHLLAGSLDNEPVLLFLAYVNLIAVWYVFVLTVGIHIFAGVSKGRSLFVALIVWLFRVSLDVTFVTLFL